MLAVTGRGTTIVQSLKLILPPNEEIVRMDLKLGQLDCVLRVPVAKRYLLAAGILHQKPIREQSWSEMIESLAVNMVNVIRICEMVLEEEPEGRICVIGSESAIRGSFDATYAAAKAGVHAYVKSKKTGPLQQLVCVSPDIIGDSGMTQRRKDYPAVLEQRGWVTAMEVAATVKRVLYDHEPQETTGCIVRVIPKVKPHGQVDTASPT